MAARAGAAATAELAAAIRGGDRAALPRAITLVESARADHREQAQRLLMELMPAAGAAMHVGITGVPGVGKSTVIEALGMDLIDQGHRVAVLAVDPSSTRTGGSILGDKTRMARLAVHPDAYIRPSPTSGTLGGVARATRETIVLLEAAGFDVVLIETVGVGQSEVAVAGMVDTFVFMTLARTGDQLQGIKKGVLELADIVVVNKADGDHVTEAEAAARELASAIRLITPPDARWHPPVLTTSALKGTGLTELWAAVLRHRAVLTEAGEFDARRRAQQVEWTWSMVRDTVVDRVLTNPAVRKMRAEVERQHRRRQLLVGRAELRDVVSAPPHRRRRPRGLPGRTAGRRRLDGLVGPARDGALVGRHRADGVLGDQGGVVHGHPPPRRPGPHRLRRPGGPVLAGFRCQREGDDHRPGCAESSRRAVQPAGSSPTACARSPSDGGDDRGGSRRAISGQIRLPRPDLRLVALGLGAGGHRSGHARTDPRRGGSATEHRRCAPRTTPGVLADPRRRDHRPPTQPAEPAVQRRRAASGGARGVGGLRIDVLPRGEIGRAG
ncbi:MAG: methylmalonyl Co-A mutase-associated GTPase MeaB [Mycobacteriaceae bacterium]|nr:methylmalonyl Co-A mutase-associated GTPase MeaB [Mycobacteriaceae bacterium]